MYDTFLVSLLKFQRWELVGFYGTRLLDVPANFGFVNHAEDLANMWRCSSHKFLVL